LKKMSKEHFTIGDALELKWVYRLRGGPEALIKSWRGEEKQK